LTILFSNLPLLLASVIDKLGLAIEDFINRFEQMLRSVIPFASKETNKFIDPKEVQKLSASDQALLEQQLKAASTNPAIAAKKDAQEFQKAFELAVEKGFISTKFAYLSEKYIAASEARIIQRGLQSDVTQANLFRKRDENVAKARALSDNLQLPGIDKTINDLINKSKQLSLQGFAATQFIIQELRKTITLGTPAPQLNPQAFQQQITPQNNPLNVASVQNMKLIAEALVGSAQSTSRNLLKTGKPLEQKQLEEQEKTNEILEKIARERGIQFAP